MIQGIDARLKFLRSQQYESIERIESIKDSIAILKAQVDENTLILTEIRQAIITDRLTIPENIELPISGGVFPDDN